MKKVNFIKILLLAGLITSCSSSEENLKIIAPVGAPAIALYDSIDNPNFETNSTPKNILAMMTENSEKDVVVIDTISGIQAIQKNNAFKIAATITFGNFFIASTGNDENSTMDKDDKIVLFGKEQNPDKIFHCIYGDSFDENIEWVNSASDAAKCLITGTNSITQNKIDYVFLAQPAIYKALNKNTKASVYANVQEEYKKITNEEMVQASLFVNKNSDKRQINSFLNNLENSINALLKDPTSITAKLENSILGATSEEIVTILKEGNSFGLGFKKAIDNKDGIDRFLKVFNIDETKEEYYYK